VESHISLVFREMPGFAVRGTCLDLPLRLSLRKAAGVANATELHRKSGDVGFHCPFLATFTRPWRQSVEDQVRQDGRIKFKVESTPWMP
jgi:hypothetical protein